MNRFERLDLDKIDLNTVSLRKVLELWIHYDMELVLICSECKRRSKVDVIALIDRFGSASNLGSLCRLSRCLRCSAKKPKPFFVIQSTRRFSDEWFPHPPEEQ